MPPKPKCTREEIAQAAFQLIQQEGIPALTARTLAKKLGTSPSPIFTIFPNMEAVKDAAREIAMQEFNRSMDDYAEYTPAFKQIGMSTVAFSMREPELFKLIFMQEHHPAQSFAELMPQLGNIAHLCIQIIMQDYRLTEQQASLLFEQMWTYTFGLSSLCAMKVCTLTETEIGRRMGLIFAGLMMLIHSGKAEHVFDVPEKSTDGLYHGMDVHDFSFMNPVKP